MVSIYLASPYGFSEATREFLESLKKRLSEAGHKVHDPFEEGHLLLEPEADVKESTSEPIYKRVGRSNQEGIDSSDIVVAVLDGPDVDSGTASEIGYAFAREKCIIGYRGDIRQAGENEGVVVNLQVQYWIEESGGRIVRDVQGLIETLAEKTVV